MLRKHVKIGERYVAKVSGKLVVIRIDCLHSRGGWMATNENTDREVRVRTAGRLRRRATDRDIESADKVLHPTHRHCHGGN